ncbi:Ger(x)C family spore germination protein [Oceanobacillus damuensis]|uniref:Ger(x)C family spore germination protein n=1 Tax=Oceanobacillus damuensis TaxID=937928 RepID=UPI000833A3F8|nr:Ger(x)C family spore germination protein [Oceanobacillus damuensis]
MVNKKYILILIHVLLAMLISGCWDEIEVEDRALLSGVAIDFADEKGEGDRPVYEMTLQFAVPSAIGTASEGGGGKAFRNLSQTGESIFGINSDISRQENRRINTEHLDVVLVSGQISEKEGLFVDIMDVFLRQPGMRRGILLAIADGNDQKAKGLLDIEPEHEKIPARYISELMENPATPETIEPFRVGDIQEKLLNNRSFTIPQLAIFSDNSINYDGVAVFDGHTSKIVDTLKGDEVKGLNYITGKEQLGSVTAELEGELVGFIVLEGSSKIKLTNKDKQNLQFQVDVEVEAQLTEYRGNKDFYKKGNLEKFEKALKDKIEQTATDTVKKVKDDLQVDVLTFADHLRGHHYELWEKVKDNWDHGENYFSKSDVTFNVTATLREPGNTIQLKKEGDKE